MAEDINLPSKLVSVPEHVRPMPDMYHARTGHVMPDREVHSRVLQQLRRTKQYADENEMKINFKKTKMMLFNPCTSIDYLPQFAFDDQELEVVEEMRVLGITITSDMKWATNTHNMVTRANKKLWVLRRLKNSGAKQDDLVDIYSKQVRCLLEFAVPAWHGGINLDDQIDIERIQKSACHIILGDSYSSYKNALKTLCLDSLSVRRNGLCLKFAKKAEKHPKHSKWFKPNDNDVNTRQTKTKYKEVLAKHSRLQKSPLSFLTDMLHDNYKK